MMRTTKRDLKTLVTLLTTIKNIEDDEQDRHIPIFTMEELSIAIGSQESKAEDLKGADEDTTKNDALRSST